MNFFHHKDLGNHLLQLCPKVVKHPVCEDNEKDTYHTNMVTNQFMKVITIHKII